MAAKTPLVAVVDDEEDVRHALQRLLRAAGFEVLVYASGMEFLRHAQESAPDCVVLDLHMPGQSGFEVQLELSRRRLPIPVVAITGNDSIDGRRRALANGADAYLCKPMDDEALIGAITGAIQGHAPAD